MDEHKTQQPEPEIVPARRKSGRMRSWKASILACVICILVTALVTSLIFVGKFGGSRNYKLALKFAQVKQVVDRLGGEHVVHQVGQHRGARRRDVERVDRAGSDDEAGKGGEDDERHDARLEQLHIVARRATRFRDPHMSERMGNVAH